MQPSNEMTTPRRGILQRGKSFAQSTTREGLLQKMSSFSQQPGGFSGRNLSLSAEVVMLMNFNEAETYEQISSIEQEDGLELISMLGIQEDGSKILDLGCGTGNLAKVMANMVGPEGHVVGIDPDIERIELSKKMHSASNLEFLVGCGEAIPGFEYDLILSNHVLHWCKQKDLVFSEVAKSLKSGGIFAYICLLQSEETAKYFNLLGAELKEEVTDQVYSISEDEATQLAESYKFKELYRSTHECVHTFQNMSEYFSFFLTHTKHEHFSMKGFHVDPHCKSSNGDEKVYFKYPVLTCILQKE